MKKKNLKKCALLKKEKKKKSFQNEVGCYYVKIYWFVLFFYGLFFSVGKMFSEFIFFFISFREG